MKSSEEKYVEKEKHINNRESDMGVKNSDKSLNEKSLPNVFSFTDYRTFLKEFYEFKKRTHQSFSLATFATKAGIKTRNYLKRVIDGERSLNPNLIPKFCNGLGLKPKERTYFEALVHFNQAKDEDIKKHYFEVLKVSSVNEPGRAIEILENQYEVFNHWYILPIRELVLLKEFHEDPKWIVQKMKNRISKNEALNALQILLKLGLLVRDEKTNRLKQSNPIIRYSQEVINMVVREYHKQTLNQTHISIDLDSFNSWDVRSLNLAISKSDFPIVCEELKDFIKKLNERFTLKQTEVGAQTSDTVIQLNAQVVQLTK